MAESIVAQIAALKTLTVGQLREVYAEKFGQPSTSRNKPWLFKRIAWRIQELAEGGLSERAKKKAEGKRSAPWVRQAAQDLMYSSA
jgi:hypothetical protein